MHSHNSGAGRQGGGKDGFGDGGGIGGGDLNFSSQHEDSPGLGHVKPTVSAQQLTSHFSFCTNPALHLHWLAGSPSTHVGSAGGGIGGGIGGGEGEGETQHTVAAPHSLGTSGTQHLLTVAVSGANF